MGRVIAIVAGIIAAVAIVVYGSFALYEGSWSLTAHNVQHQLQIQQQQANGQASIAVNGTQNHIDQYNMFYDEYANYQSALESVATNLESLKTFQKTYTPAEIASDPTGNLTQILGQDEAAVTAAQQACTRDGTKYNNDSEKVQTGAKWKGVDLSKTVSLIACEKGSLTGATQGG